MDESMRAVDGSVETGKDVRTMPRKRPTRQTSIRLDEETDLLQQALAEKLTLDGLAGVVRFCVKESADKRGVTVSEIRERQAGEKKGRK